MKKIIKFPLILKDEKNARTLDELKEFFDMGKILEYYHTGKLLIWLETRGLKKEAKRIEDISPAYPEYIQQICEIFGVEYVESY